MLATVKDGGAKAEDAEALEDPGGTLGAAPELLPPEWATGSKGELSITVGN